MNVKVFGRICKFDVVSALNIYMERVLDNESFMFCVKSSIDAVLF